MNFGAVSRWGNIIFGLLFFSGFSLTAATNYDIDKMWVPEAQLNAFERAYWSMFLTDTGLSEENTDFLLRDILDRSESFDKRKSWKIFPVVSTWFPGNAEMHFPLEKKAEIEERLKKGKEYRDSFVKTSLVAQSTDLQDRRVKVLDDIERILALHALEQIQPDEADAPLTEIQKDQFVRNQFFKKYMRDPRAGDAFDNFELRKLRARALFQSTPRKVLSASIDDFEKRKERLLLRLKEERLRLDNACIQELTDFYNQNPEMIQSFVDSTHLVNDFLAPRFTPKGKKVKLSSVPKAIAIIFNPAQIEKGNVVSPANIRLRLDDGSEWDLPNSYFQTFWDRRTPTNTTGQFHSTNLSESTHIAALKEAKRVSSPQDNKMKERVSNLWDFHVRNDVDYLLDEIARSKNDADLNDKIRNYYKELSPDEISQKSNFDLRQVPTRSNISERNNIHEDLLWYGFSKDPNFWKSETGKWGKKSFSLYKSLYSLGQRTKTLAKNSPRYLRNAVLATMLIGGVGGGSVYVYNHGVPSWREAKQVANDQADRAGNWFSFWGSQEPEAGMGSDDQAPHNYDFKDGQEKVLFLVNNVPPNTSFVTARLNSIENLMHSYPAQYVAGSIGDIEISSAANIIPNKGIIPIPSPHTGENLDFHGLRSLEVRSATTGGIISPLNVLYDKATGSYFIDNRDEKLPRFNFSAKFYSGTQGSDPESIPPYINEVEKEREKLKEELAHKKNELVKAKIQREVESQKQQERYETQQEGEVHNRWLKTMKELRRYTNDKLYYMLSEKQVRAKYLERSDSQNRGAYYNSFLEEVSLLKDAIEYKSNNGRLDWTKSYTYRYYQKINNWDNSSRSEQDLHFPDESAYEKSDAVVSELKKEVGKIEQRFQGLVLQDVLYLKPEKILPILDKLEAAGFPKLAQVLKEKFKDKRPVDIASFNKTFADNTIYAIHAEPDPDPKKFDPTNPFTAMSHFSMDGTLCAVCNGGKELMKLILIEYYKGLPDVELKAIPCFVDGNSDKKISVSEGHVTLGVFHQGKLLHNLDATPQLTDPRPPVKSKFEEFLKKLKKKLGIEEEEESVNKNVVAGEEDAAKDKDSKSKEKKLPPRPDVIKETELPSHERQPADRPPRPLTFAQRKEEEEEDEKKQEEDLLPDKPKEVQPEKSLVVTKAKDDVVDPDADLHPIFNAQERWKALIREEISKEQRAVEGIVNGSEIRKRFNVHSDSGEIHFVLARMLSDLDSLSSSLSSSQSIFRDENGVLVSPKEYVSEIRTRLKKIERSFYEELNAYVKNPKNNPRKYPFADAYDLVNRLLTVTEAKILSAYNKIPYDLLNATPEQLSRLGSYEERRHARSFFHEGGKSCFSALKGTR